MRATTAAVAAVGALVTTLLGLSAEPVRATEGVEAAAPSYTWEPARVDGGGFMTVLAPSPGTKGLWLAGSDVAGVFRSTDGGRTWLGSTKGFEAGDQRKVGAIEWDPFNAKRAWACVGAVRPTGPSGAVVRSLDAGLTWATVSTDAFCSGGVFAGSGVTEAHPRSTGRLLIADATKQNRVWIGTLVDGVKRSTDGGVTWAPRGLAGLPVRGLALDPQNPDALYAAVRAPTGSGVYRSVDANGANPTWQLMPGPAYAEELAIVGRRLYVAAGNQGVWAADLSAPTPVLVRVGEASLPVGLTTDVMTITATVVKGVETLLVGLDPDAVCLDVAATWCPTLWRSTDAGATWTPLPAGPAGVHPQIGGPTGPVWRQTEFPTSLLGGSSHVTSDVQVDPFTKTRILLAGRAGIWRSTDSGANWYPVPRGLTMTFHGEPATDTAAPGSVVVPTSDWHLFGTSDNGRTVTGIPFAADGGTAARVSGWIGAGSSPLYVGVGFGVPDSELYVQETPGAPFVALGFGAASHAHGVLAVAARDVGGERVVVAIGRGAGVWRKVGAGPWTQAALVPGGLDGTVIARTGTLAWAPDGALYASDRGDAASTGVWRSLDSGATWQRITPLMMDIAADPSAAHRLWLAGADQVWRVDDARSGTTDAQTLVISRLTQVPAARLVEPDPMGGVVVVTSQVAAAVLGQKGAHGKVLRSTNGGQTFVLRSTDDVARGLVEPVGLAIDPAGVIHITTFGFGWWVGRPS